MDCFWLLSVTVAVCAKPWLIERNGMAIPSATAMPFRVTVTFATVPFVSLDDRPNVYWNVMPETKELMSQLAFASVWLVIALPWTERLLK